MSHFHIRNVVLTSWRYSRIWANIWYVWTSQLGLKPKPFEKEISSSVGGGGRWDSIYSIFQRTLKAIFLSRGFGAEPPS